MSLFKKPAFGLDLSDHSVEVMELARKGKEYSLAAMGRMFVPEGLISDGRIMNKERLANLLHDLTQHTYPKKISGRDVVLSLPESQVFIHSFMFPKNLGTQQLRAALRYEAEGIIPLPAEDVYFDFQVNPAPQRISGNGEGGGQEQQEVIYVAVSKDVVNEYVALMALLKWRAIALDIQSYALARALLLGYNEAQMAVLVDIGAKTTLVSIAEKGFVRFSTTIAAAGDALTDEVERKQGVSGPEAERMKIQGGILEFPYLEETVSRIAQEVRKTIEFAAKRFGVQAGRVLVTGGSASLPGLLVAMQKALPVPVALGRPWLIAEDSPLISTLLLAEVTGLALRGAADDPSTSGINLLPRQEK